MAMQINGDYSHSGTDYAERVMEKTGCRGGGKNKGGRRRSRGKMCVGNTDKVDREIKKLKEKKQGLLPFRVAGWGFRRRTYL